MPTVITQGAATAKAYGFSAQAAGAGRGCAVYTTPGTYTFTVPAGVTSISMVAIGGGGNGGSSSFFGYYCCSYYWGNGVGGGAGGLGYKNNYTVSPGQTLTVVVGSSYLYSGVLTSSCTLVVAGYGGSTGPGGGAGYSGCGGGYGGSGGNNVLYCGSPVIFYSGGGGGAGGYAGNGGNGYCAGCCVWATCGSGGGGGGGGGSYNGGGTGLYGQGANGASGGRYFIGGTGSPSCFPCCTGTFGAGGGGSYTYTYVGCCCGYAVYAGTPGQCGQSGAVRIVYPGTTRQFPSTDVGYP